MVEGRRRRSVRSRQPDTSSWTDAEREELRRRQTLETPVAEMKLCVRVINALEEGGVIQAKDLMRQTYESLMAMRNFGEKTLADVRVALQKLGLEPPAWDKPPGPPKYRVSRKDVIEFW